MSTSEYNGETFTHEYYLCGRMPVVALIAEDGLWAGTKAPNKETGQLAFSDHIDYIQCSGNPDIEKITEEEFNRRCNEIWEKADRAVKPDP